MAQSSHSAFFVVVVVEKSTFMTLIPCSLRFKRLLENERQCVCVSVCVCSCYLIMLFSKDVV